MRLPCVVELEGVVAKPAELDEAALRPKWSKPRP